MKTAVILIALFFASMTLFAKVPHGVPDNVKESFAKLYPNVTDVKWDKEDANHFEAEFVENGKTVSLLFDNNGTLQETETEIAVTELPANVQTVINEKYAGYKITDASKIVDKDGTVTFEAEISNKKLQKELIFDLGGNFLNEQPVDDEDSEEDDD